MNLFALSGLLTGLSSLAFGSFVYFKGCPQTAPLALVPVYCVGGGVGLWRNVDCSRTRSDQGFIGLASFLCLRRRMDTNFVPPLHSCVLQPS